MVNLDVGNGEEEEYVTLVLRRRTADGHSEIPGWSAEESKPHGFAPGVRP